jgi:hypothetical protein
VVDRPVTGAEAPCRATSDAAVDEGLGSWPRANPAAMAEANEQPVPWTLGVSMRSLLNTARSDPWATTSVASPSRWPPFTTTQAALSAASSRAASEASSVLLSGRPRMAEASSRLGVMTSAWGKSNSR